MMLDAILKAIDPVQILLGILACMLTQAVISFFHARPLRRKIKKIAAERDRLTDLLAASRDNYGELAKAAGRDGERINVLCQDAARMRRDLDEFIASADPVFDAARRVIEHSIQTTGGAHFIINREDFIALQMALIKFDADADAEPETEHESDAPVFLPLLMNQE